MEELGCTAQLPFPQHVRHSKYYLTSALTNQETTLTNSVRQFLNTWIILVYLLRHFAIFLRTFRNVDTRNKHSTQQLCTSAKPRGNTTPCSYCLLYLAICLGNLLVFQLQPQVGSHMHLVFHHSLTELLLPETASSSSA